MVQLKTGKGTRQACLWRRQHRANKAHGRIVSITGHQRNTTEISTEYTHAFSFPLGKLQSAMVPNGTKGSGGTGSLIHCWKEGKMAQPLSQKFLKMANQRVTM